MADNNKYEEKKITVYCLYFNNFFLLLKNKYIDRLDVISVCKLTTSIDMARNSKLYIFINF